jgi:hypothetical protein
MSRPDRRRLNVPGPVGVLVAHQKAPSVIRKHGSWRLIMSPLTVPAKS